MSFDWGEYLVLAHQLAGFLDDEVSEEAKLRTAISRAYYAAFHAAQTHLREKDLERGIPPTGRAHQFVAEKYSTHPDETRQKIGTNLERLRSKRIYADYRNSFRSLPNETKYTLRLAQKILEWLETL